MKRFGFLGVCVWLGVAGAAAPGALGQWNTPNPVVSFEKRADGLEVRQKDGVLRLEVKADDLLHVTYSPLAGPGDAATPVRASDSVVIKKDWPGAAFEVSSDEKSVSLSTAKVKAVIERASGALHYIGTEGTTGAGATGPGSSGPGMRGKLLTTDSYRSLLPVEVNGEKALHAEVFFGNYGSREGLYGLGQHQAGVWNYRGETVDLSQENTNIAIPLLVSSNGFGIFWNNPSRSRRTRLSGATAS
jgi:alpha-D-xyloside xylohydrolase